MSSDTYTVTLLDLVKGNCPPSLRRIEAMPSRVQLAAAHAAEWDYYMRVRLNAALASGEEKECKIAKVLADCIRLRQDGERRCVIFCDTAQVPTDGACAFSWEGDNASET